jgi:predicted transcriptional regulator
MPKRTVANPNDQLITELTAIKRLMALLLLKAGASQEEVSMALQLDRSQVSRMLPTRKVKNFNFIS